MSLTTSHTIVEGRTVRTPSLCLLRRKIETEERGSVDTSIVDQIEIDVRRTDRSNPYYSGEGNRHVGALKLVLPYIV